MKSKRAMLIAGASLLLVPSAVLAHHTLKAQFDMKQTIALTGAVTKMDWSNPHVRLYLDVRDESKRVTWELYMGSPNQQMMNGWKIDTYRRGDRVRVDAYPAKDGSSVGFAKTVTAVYGRMFSAPPGPPNQGGRCSTLHVSWNGSIEPASASYQ